MSTPDKTDTSIHVPDGPVAPSVPDHELIRVIGTGSSGQVWLARNALGTYRAIKIVSLKSFHHRRPFDREFQGIQKFEPVSRLHDGLVDILQVGGNESIGYFYCVMELADDVTTGPVINPDYYTPRTLAHDVARQRRIPVGECVRLGAAVASALGFLHRHGLIHRDIKPSNIIFVNGFPKLADIGLVMEISSARSYLGTEGFIAPEGAGTIQADIYSLGKVLYEISTGKDRQEYPELPHDLQNDPEGRDLIQFNKIITKACRTNPRERFKSAEQMMTAILSFQFGVWEEQRVKAGRSRERIIGMVGALAAAGFLVSIVWRLIWLLRQH
jgi:serine/threonine protein kinase